MGTINFTFANIAIGRITATPTQAFTDDQNRLVVGGKPFASATIASGAASLTIPSTENIGVPYDFVVEEGTSPNFTVVDRFRRIAPNASPVNASGLLTQFFAPDNLDASVDAISRRLVVEPYITALSQRIPGFTYFAWTATQVFARNQFTGRGDRIFRYIGNTQQAGVDPLIAANVAPAVGAVWEEVLRAPTGAGTTTTDVEYNATAFTNLRTEPASRRNLVQAISGVAAPDLTNYARRDQAQSWTGKQTFGAGAAGVTSNPGTNNTDLATNAFVQAAIGAVSGASAIPEPIFWSRRSADVSPVASTRQIINWDATLKGSHSNGVITLPVSGFYVAISQLTFLVSSNFSAAGSRIIARAVIHINGNEASDLIALNTNENEGSQQWRLTGFKPFSATAGDTIDVRFLWGKVVGASSNTGSPSAKIEGSIPNNFLMLFRMAG